MYYSPGKTPWILTKISIRLMEGAHGSAYVWIFAPRFLGRLDWCYGGKFVAGFIPPAGRLSRYSYCFCTLSIPERFPLGRGNGVLSNRRRLERGRQGRIDLGSFFSHRGESEGRRHRRCRLRFLPSLQGRHSDREEVECEKLPLFDFLAAHPSRRHRQTEPEGFGLLQACGRHAARSEHPPAGHFVSLGFAATVAGCRWLAESRYGGPLHGLFGTRDQGFGRSRFPLVHFQ